MVTKHELWQFFEEFASSANFSDYAPENVLDVVDITEEDEGDDECWMER